MRKIIIYAAVFFMSWNGCAESFKVKQLRTIDLPATGSSETIKCTLSDGLAVNLCQDRSFIEGIELNLKVPQQIAEKGENIMCCLYGTVTPAPDKATLEYSGKPGVSIPIGCSYHITCQIPLYQNNSIKKDPYSVYMDYVPEIADGKVFIRFICNEKKCDRKLMETEFEVSVKPLLKNKGILTVRCTPPSNTVLKPYTVFIDDKPVTGCEKITVSAGTHNLSVVSDYYRNEVRTVTVEQAKESVINIKFRDIAPSIRIIAPAGTAVFIDDVKQSGTKEELTITQGSHTIRFSLGGYETVKAINTVNGKSYTLSLTFDTEVLESE